VFRQHSLLLICVINHIGFSENFFDRLDIIEGETDLSVLKDKLWNGNNVILMGEYDDHGNF